MRSRRRTAVAAVMASMLAGPAASRAAAPEHPVASCPPGRVSLSVAFCAQRGVPGTVRGHPRRPQGDGPR